jgi:mRNA interferase RelE/StbE
MYSLKIHKKALKFLNAQTPALKSNIRQKLNLLKENPFSHELLDIKKLKDTSDYFRLRVRNIRIIYKIDGEVLLILITNAGNRGEIYKKK